MRPTDMKPFCATYARGYRPQRSICEEMVRRFQVTDAEIRERGGILNTATHYADQEYVNTLSSTPWKAPRGSPAAFVRFLDRMGFTIPWYLEKRAHVDRLNAAARRALTDCAARPEPRCVDEGRNLAMANAIAGALLMGQSGGWKVEGQLALDSERSPDKVLQDRAARCSEWLTALKGASLFVGGDVRAQLVPGEQYHLEVYWTLNETTGKRWNLKLSEGSNTPSQATTTFSSAAELLSPADIVVSISINRILSSNAGVQKKHTQLKALQNWGGAEPVRGWLKSAIEVYANSGS